MENSFKSGEFGLNDYVLVKANSRDVTVLGLTRGEETKPLHAEKLDEGEILIAQFTSNTSAIKIRGDAEVYTKFGMVKSGK